MLSIPINRINSLKSLRFSSTHSLAVTAINKTLSLAYSTMFSSGSGGSGPFSFGDSGSPHDHPNAIYPTKTINRNPGLLFKSLDCYRDGKRIVSAQLTTIETWNLHDEKHYGKTLRTNMSVEHMALSPDQRMVICGDFIMLSVWDLRSGRMMWKDNLMGRTAVFSPDGRFIAVGNMIMVVLLDARTGEMIGEPFDCAEMGVEGSVAFSLNGMQLAIASFKGTVEVFEVSTSRMVSGLIDAVGSMAGKSRQKSHLKFAFDGIHLLVALGDNLYTLNAQTGDTVGKPMTGHRSRVTRIALHPDGRRVASVSWDSTTRIWDIITQQQVGEVLQPGRGDLALFYSVAWSPDGRTLVAGSMGSIFMWDIPPFESGVVSSPPPLAPSRGGSVSSSFLDTPLGPPLPDQPPTQDDTPSDTWEYSTNESFDSLLDLPADGTQPAQRRKRRRRQPISSSRGAPDKPETSSTPTTEISAVNMPADVEPSAGHDNSPALSTSTLPSDSRNTRQTKPATNGSPSPAEDAPDCASTPNTQKSGSADIVPSPPDHDNSVPLTAAPIASDADANSALNEVVSPTSPLPLPNDSNAESLPNDPVPLTSPISLSGQPSRDTSRMPNHPVPPKSLPATSTGVNPKPILSAPLTSPRNFFLSIWAHLRRPKRELGPIKMQPLRQEIPKYSPVAKVALGEADPVSVHL
ncbi:hypothetical protein BJ138DRAFT_1210571 [Hygrophoropsis aurantiaca]|uniref:Uncharacterized protein n=1 Tax=Hygrophoropsis aurantiaca TaxID=72124 RepID=A0ACB8A2J1_9AGAM|nr:hypothetical protein BJ138DRAFT_1210571 [Hygrophoropsis aurantiaca]